MIGTITIPPYPSVKRICDGINARWIRITAHGVNDRAVEATYFMGAASPTKRNVEPGETLFVEALAVDLSLGQTPRPTSVRVDFEL